MPTPEEIKAARLAAGLTQRQAAERIGYKLRSWEDWEQGKRNMRQVVFDVFKTKTKHLKGKTK